MATELEAQQRRRAVDQSLTSSLQQLRMAITELNSSGRTPKGLPELMKKITERYLADDDD